MSDASLSTALKEAYAVAPRDHMYHTLEIRHATIDPPIRVVMGGWGISAKLEAAAPANPSETVEWLAFAFSITPPDIQASGSPRMMIELENVSRIIMAAIESAMDSTTPVEVTYRIYLESGLTVGPENNPPLNLTATTVHIDQMRIKIEVGYPDMGQKKFPRRVYSAQEFPGLVI
ncbi:MAG: DUF1833 family protein [Magnetococcales bacterium]|nr:DUF1833 family protein [Magnetococcales bacterium]MBF0438301.1 DUF1833 family protein [Magnetococcales bacterium]